MTTTLETSIDIAATPDRVWSVVSDLSRMPEWSPQCRKMIVLGTPRQGAHTVNVNRQGWKVWPTTARIVRFEPNKAVAFKINENRTIWTYELEATATGTKLTERREAPNGTTALSRFLVDKALGGTEPFEAELTQGMRQSLNKIKQAVES